MKTYQELKSMGIDFNSLENERQKALQLRKKKSLPAQIIGIVSIVVGLILFFISAGAAIAVIIVGVIVAIVYYAIVSSRAKNQLKSKIMNNFFSKLNMDFVFGDTTKGNELRRSAIKSGFLKGVSITSEDVISGSINGQPFVMGDVRMSRKKSSGTSNTSTSVTVFQGPLGFVNTSNNYPYTSILPDKVEKALGGIGKLMQKADISRLNQKNIYFKEDPEFEKYFVVWSKDENFIRNTLTPQFRNYLTGMESMSNVYVGFRDEKIIAGIDLRRDLFNLPLKKPLSDEILKQFYDDFAKFYEYMENILSLVQTGNTAQPVSQSTDEVPPQPTDNVPPSPSDEVPPQPTDDVPPPPPIQ